MLRFEGTLKSWNDDKGFGFISPSQGGQDIFLHISEYRPGGRPSLTDALSFEVALNPQGKKRAVNVQRADAQQGAYRPTASQRPVRVSRSGNSVGGLTKVIALLLVGALGWQAYVHYQNRAMAARANAGSDFSLEPARPLDFSPSRTGAASFSCDGRQHCSQMRSCAEATYFLKNCPDTKMDGDHDGIPCEDQLCR